MKLDGIITQALSSVGEIEFIASYGGTGISYQPMVSGTAQAQEAGKGYAIVRNYNAEGGDFEIQHVFLHGLGSTTPDRVREGVKLELAQLRETLLGGMDKVVLTWGLPAYEAEKMVNVYEEV